MIRTATYPVLASCLNKPVLYRRVCEMMMEAIGKQSNLGAVYLPAALPLPPPTIVARLRCISLA